MRITCDSWAISVDLHIINVHNAKSNFFIIKISKLEGYGTLMNKLYVMSYIF
jgi:hypothetical protein